MSKQHNLTLLWDDTIFLDESVLATLKSVGLAPLPVNVHTIDRIEHEIVGPTILHLSADSFANLEAVSAFVRNLSFEAFGVLRIQQHQFDLGMEAVRCGIDEVVVHGMDSQKIWERVIEKAATTLLKQDSYIFVDETSQHLLALIERVGASEVNALMNGPTGSGKEVLARLAHDFSPRQEGPFVPVNCAALPESLAESLLFGHAKGAFTGATKSTVGFFEQAENGTLFLDEVGELPLQVQAKLLRAIQEREITPVGSAETKAVNVRILAATNRDLRQAIRQGSFREDLYFRISTFRINVPGLKDRKDDILPLCNYFLIKHGRNGQEAQIAPDALGNLLNYEWPGNVRELENVIQRAVVLSGGDPISSQHLFFDEPIFSGESYSDDHLSSRRSLEPAPVSEHQFRGSEAPMAVQPAREGLHGAMEANEFRVISETIRNARTRKEAAALLGISERTLRYKVSRMKDRGFDIPKRRSA